LTQKADWRVHYCIDDVKVDLLLELAGAAVHGAISRVGFQLNEPAGWEGPDKWFPEILYRCSVVSNGSWVTLENSNPRPEVNPQSSLNRGENVKKKGKITIRRETFMNPFF
jgi:hypothetical protein